MPDQAHGIGAVEPAEGVQDDKFSGLRQPEHRAEPQRPSCEGRAEHCPIHLEEGPKRLRALFRSEFVHGREREPRADDRSDVGVTPPSSTSLYRIQRPTCGALQRQRDARRLLLQAESHAQEQHRDLDHRRDAGRGGADSTSMQSRRTPEVPGQVIPTRLHRPIEASTFSRIPSRGRARSSRSSSSASGLPIATVRCPQLIFARDFHSW